MAASNKNQIEKNDQFRQLNDGVRALAHEIVFFSVFMMHNSSKKLK